MTDPLVLAWQRQHWNDLWLKAIPNVRPTLLALVREGAIPNIDDDLIGVANLALGQAVRRWNPSAHAFATHVSSAVRTAVLNYYHAEGARGASGHRTVQRGRPVQYVGTVDQLEANGNEAIPNPIPEPQAEVERMHDWEAVRRAVDKLDTTDAALIEAVFTVGMTQEEAAEQVGVSQQRAAQRLQRGIRSLRSMLTEARPARGDYGAETGFWRGRSERDPARKSSVAPGDIRPLFPVDQITDRIRAKKEIPGLWKAVDWSWKPTAHDIAGGCKP